MKPSMLAAMSTVRLLSVFSTALLLAGCTSYQMGNDHAGDNGSYTGGTLNSPVTDQNPHVGGDSTYPSSVSDQGRQQVPINQTGY
jgi:hypothetical protein